MARRREDVYQAEAPTDAEPRRLTQDVDRGVQTRDSRSKFYASRIRNPDLYKLQRTAVRLLLARMCELDDAPRDSWKQSDVDWLTSVAEMTSEQLVAAGAAGIRLTRKDLEAGAEEPEKPRRKPG